MQLPDALAHPVAIISSNTKNNTTLVAMLEIQQNGKQVIVPAAIDGYGVINFMRIDSNAITSAYGKSNSISNMLSKALEEEANGNAYSVYYLDKGKATALYQGARVPMPKVPQIKADGFVHSIRESGSPVKPKFGNVTESQQFKRWFGDWQNHPESASKVVNKDGTRKIMYHGTPGKGFTVFDTNKAENGSLGKGFYFSGSKEYAKGHTISNGKFSGTVIETYLDAKNPYIAKYPGGIDTAKLMADGYDSVYNPSNDFWVVFKPTQIKSATDNIGTFDPTNSDIRFSMKDAVEETRDLIAGHNLNGDQLEADIELGGFPMPSIAITKSKIGHSKYGDVSVIFGKDTLKPNLSGRSALMRCWKCLKTMR